MDQMNLLPNGPPRLASTSDPLIPSSPGPWIVDTHTSLMSPWHAQTLPLGSFYLTNQHTSTNSEPGQPTQSSQLGALPYPDRSRRVLHNSDPTARFSASSIYWNPNLQPMSASVDHATGSDLSTDVTTVSSTPETGSDSMNTGIRGLALQPPPAADWAPSGAASDSLSMTPSLFSISSRLGNVSHSSNPSLSGTMLAYPLSPISPRRSTQIPLTASERTQQSQSSTSAFEHRDFTRPPSPAPDRRRQAYSRARRAMTSRQSDSNPLRMHDEPAESSTAIPRPRRRVSLTDDMIARQMQLFRGTASSKLVASKAAIQSLEAVEISTLPKSEMTCVICYNDYGVASPEGINESPLRLPPCKHIFGDHCIKKWLEDSDSCPYCRCKLHSEPKHIHGSARTFLSMMRMRGIPLPTGFTDELVARLTTRQITDTELQDLFNRAARTAERRPPPDDVDSQDQRRTRQRRSGPVPSEDRVSDIRATHARSAIQSAPSSQYAVPSQELLSENSWSIHSAAPRQTPSSLAQRLQPRLVMGEGTAQFNGPDNRLGQADSTISAPRPGDTTMPVVVNGSSLRDRSIPNPLQSRFQPHADSSAALNPSASAHASLLSSLENSTQRPINAQISPPRPNRNRPW